MTTRSPHRPEPIRTAAAAAPPSVSPGMPRGVSRGVHPLAALLGVVITLGACADTASDAPDDVAALRLEALPPIEGEADADGSGFGRIADIEIGDDGSVYVLDAMDRTVRAFDARGEHRGTYGGRGGGPGELERPTTLAWGPDGNLWVADAGNARYTVFDPDGALVASYRGLDPYVYQPLAIGFSPAGRLRTVALALELGGLERPRTVLIEAEVGDDRVREVGRTELPFADPPAVFRHEAAGMVLVLRVPFTPQPVFRIDGEGRLWYAATGDPWVRRWSASDGFVRTIGREFDAPPVTPAELDAVRRREDVRELRSAAGRAGVDEFIRLVPDRKPHLQGVVLGDDGHVWTLRTAADTASDTLAMDVYDADAALVGVVRAALEPEPRPRLRDGLLVGVVRDELGAESVARYRVRR